MSADGRGLHIKQLAKHFGGVRVFDDVTFDVPPRQVTALLGPNGAGKTTIINIICGIFPADHGEVYLGGGRVSSASSRTRPSSAGSCGPSRTCASSRL